MKNVNKHGIEVLCLNPFYDIKNDLRLNFLMSELSVNVKYIYEINKSSILHKIMAKISKIQRIYVNKNSFIGKVYIKCFYNLICLKYYYNTNNYPIEWGLEYFKKAKIFIFDFLKKDMFISNTIFEVANVLKIPTMAVPPGVTLWYESLGTVKAYDDYKFPDYNYIITQHDIRKKLMIKIGGPEDKMYSLGVPRFCDEWIPILNKIIPNRVCQNKNDNQKLRLLFIDRPVSHQMNKELVFDTIEKISSLEFIDLKIKPHPRSNILFFNEFKEYADISYVDSVELIRWSDVVIGTVSSILLEAFVQGKTVLYPKYMHNIVTTHEKMESCWNLKSVDSLIDALYLIKDNRKFKDYSNYKVQQLITRLVYASRANKDVLKTYSNFINSKISYK